MHECQGSFLRMFMWRSEPWIYVLMLFRNGYPLADRPSSEDLKKLGLESLPKMPLAIRAIYAQEKRPPKAGEWYLSGSTPEAYRAPNDLSTAYHIAKLTVLKQVQGWVGPDVTEWRDPG